MKPTNNRKTTPSILISAILIIPIATMGYSVTTANAAEPGMTFGAVQNLSSNAGDSNYPKVASSDGHTYIAWVDDTPGNFDLFLKASSNNGGIFGSTINLSENAGDSGSTHDFVLDAQAFDIAAKGDNVYVIWTDLTANRILFRASNDNGATFGSAVDLGAASFLSIPRVGISPTSGTVYAVWDSGEIMLRMSNDNGASFGPAINISNTPTNSVFPELAAIGSTLYMAWEDEKCKVYFRAAYNNGAAFGGRKLIDDDGEDCEELKNVKVESVRNYVYVGWTQSITQPALRISQNSGSTFGPEKLIGGDAIADLAVVGNNVYYAFADNDLFIATSHDNGATFEPEINLSESIIASRTASMSAIGSNVYVAWYDSNIYDILLSTSADNGDSFETQGISNNGGFSFSPDIAATKTNVFIVWMDNTPGNYEIMFRVAGDTTAPNTKITQKLDGNGQPIANNGSTNSTTAKFSFYAIDDSTPSHKHKFECRLDSNEESAFSQCVRPTTYTGLSLGEHAFEVRATDKAGNTDPTPAKLTWNVVTP